MLEYVTSRDEALLPLSKFLLALLLPLTSSYILEALTELRRAGKNRDSYAC